MNEDHFVVIYSIIAVALLTVLLVRGENVVAKRAEIEAIEESVDFATYSAVCTLSESYGEPNAKERAASEFFRAFALTDASAGDDIWVYVPAFVFLDNDGFFVGGYNTEKKGYDWAELRSYELSYDGVVISFTLYDTVVFRTEARTASVKMSDFFLSDKTGLDRFVRNDIIFAESILSAIGYASFTREDYERMKASAVATSVSLQVTERINNHNEIVGAGGTTYIYTTPAFVDLNTKLPSFIVCFQGYPLVINGDYYSNMVERAAYLRKVGG